MISAPCVFLKGAYVPTLAQSVSVVAEKFGLYDYAYA